MTYRVRVALLLAAALLAPLHSGAQERYPSRPVKLVVGYPPGGSVDFMARLLADALGPKLDTAVVVDNVGGAAGSIGAARVAAAPPDGYTLLVGSSNEIVGTGVLNREQKYDGRRDFTALALAATGPMVLLASPGSGVRTVQQFVDVVRQNPGKFSYGSPGIGSTMHFAGELAKQRAGLFLLHIPYRGVTPLATDLTGNVIEFGFMSPSAAVPLVQSGRLVALGVTGHERLPQLPNLPALGENPALAGYELIGWIGVLAPRGVPAEVEATLKRALHAAVQDPVYRRRVQEAGGVLPTGNEDFARLIEEDTAKYLSLATFAKLR